jgi:hypothetical protein
MCQALPASLNSTHVWTPASLQVLVSPHVCTLALCGGLTALLLSWCFAVQLFCWIAPRMKACQAGPISEVWTASVLPAFHGHSRFKLWVAGSPAGICDFPLLLRSFNACSLKQIPVHYPLQILSKFFRHAYVFLSIQSQIQRACLGSRHKSGAVLLFRRSSLSIQELLQCKCCKISLFYRGFSQGQGPCSYQL